MIGRNVAALREAHGLTQAALADLVKLCGLAWLKATVAKVETGRRDVTAGELVALGLVLDASLEQLLKSERPLRLGKSDQWVPAEAVGMWTRGERPDMRHLRRWAEAEVKDPSRARLSRVTPQARRLIAASARIAQQMEQQLAGTRAFMRSVELARAEVERELTEWTESEESAGRPVTPHRRRAKEAYLWRQHQ